MEDVLEVQVGIETPTALPAFISKKLPLGCFEMPIPGWINTDITPHLWVARIPSIARLLWRMGRISDERYYQHRRGLFRAIRYINVAMRFPYPDNCFGAIFSSQLLEHLYPRMCDVACRKSCERFSRAVSVAP
jgi:hypothetical protein